MKAITVEPMKSGSAQFEEIAEPDFRSGSVPKIATADVG